VYRLIGGRTIPAEEAAPRNLSFIADSGAKSTTKQLKILNKSIANRFHLPRKGFGEKAGLVLCCLYPFEAKIGRQCLAYNCTAKQRGID
jgi:hypothetical protein